MQRRFLSIALVLVMLTTLCSCGKKGPTWQEQYDLGVRFLSDGNYEEAIIAFAAAIDIDPQQEESYLSLAEVYWAKKDWNSALEILRRGFNATESKRLELYVKAEEANAFLRDNADAAEAMSQMFIAFRNTDRPKVAEMLEVWISIIYSEKNAVNDYSNLIYNGEQFIVDTDAPGILFGGMYVINQMYFGEHKNYVPHGKGILVTIPYGAENTNSYEYYWVEGSWDNGKVFGSAKVFADLTPSYTGDWATCEKIDCYFGEQELMASATMIESWDMGFDGPHQTTYHIEDGKLMQNEWDFDSFWGNYCRSCDLHNNCDSVLYTENFGAELYRNPFPWQSNYDSFFDSFSDEYLDVYGRLTGALGQPDWRAR